MLGPIKASNVFLPVESFLLKSSFRVSQLEPNFVKVLDVVKEKKENQATAGVFKVNSVK